MSDSRLIHRRYNDRTKNSWEVFAPHRARITNCLFGVKRAENSKLCVLGAGNCNDLDLQQLLNVYSEIHLVDLDTSALLSGVSRQEAANPMRVYLYGDTDLTGILDTLYAWTPPQPPPTVDVAQCVFQATQAAGPRLSGSFEVVCSTCVLSQLIGAVCSSLDLQQAHVYELLFAIRDRHLRLLLELLSPGGAAVLITDFVSSFTCPELGNIPDWQFAEEMTRVIEQRNFFTGANPFAILTRLQSDPALANEVAWAQLMAPWRWHLAERTYAVCAIHIVKKPMDCSGLNGSETMNVSRIGDPWITP